MTLFRATIYDTPTDPFSIDPTSVLRADDDAGLLVLDGEIAARGAFSTVRAAHPGEPLVDLRDGVLLPGFVDTHVHYPQLRAIGGLGMPLLDWLERCALPEESRFVDADYASTVAGEFLDGLVASGTTSALVFGAHFPAAMDVFFAQARARNLNITTGLVVSDRILRPDLLVTPDQALEDSRGLIERWHGQGRMSYAVTPRFSLSTSEAMLEVCGQLLAEHDVRFTSHINENGAEVQTVAGLFAGSRHYLDSYDRHGLVTERSVFAHNVHATDGELDRMAETGAWTSHCPTSNSALGSGLFPMRRHVTHGVGVALGSDIGAGTGMFLVKEALQAYFMQQLLGPEEGLPLTPTHLLYLATRAGALALGIADRVGDLSVGKEFDAVHLRPAAGTQLAVNLANAVDASDALARVFALATPVDVAGVWVRGERASATTA